MVGSIQFFILVSWRQFPSHTVADGAAGFMRFNMIRAYHVNSNQGSITQLPCCGPGAGLGGAVGYSQLQRMLKIPRPAVIVTDDPTGPEGQVIVGIGAQQPAILQ